MRGVELPPDVGGKYKSFQSQKLTNYFPDSRSQMNSQILLMNVKFQEMEPLVRTNDPIFSWDCFLWKCSDFPIHLSAFNEAVFDTLGHGWLQITLRLGNKARSIIGIFRGN